MVEDTLGRLELSEPEGGSEGRLKVVMAEAACVILVSADESVWKCELKVKREGTRRMREKGQSQHISIGACQGRAVRRSERRRKD
jgi:hypothetical protein